MQRQRPDGLAEAPEMIAGWLDWQRETVHLKCDGLSDRLAHQAPLPTSPQLSIAGVVAHLTAVERDWLEGSFLGDTSVFSANGGWDVDGRPLEELLEAYRRQCDRSRQIIDEHGLDEPEQYAPPGHQRVTLLWIVTHLVEETGRHLGHLDLLRELADGTRGE